MTLIGKFGILLLVIYYINIPTIGHHYCMHRSDNKLGAADKEGSLVSQAVDHEEDQSSRLMKKLITIDKVVSYSVCQLSKTFW